MCTSSALLKSPAAPHVSVYPTLLLWQHSPHPYCSLSNDSLKNTTNVSPDKATPYPYKYNGHFHMYMRFYFLIDTKTVIIVFVSEHFSILVDTRNSGQYFMYLYKKPWSVLHVSVQETVVSTSCTKRTFTYFLTDMLPYTL